MFPHPDDLPSAIADAGERPLITCDIVPDLLLPVFLWKLVPPFRELPAVPEIPIDEYRDALLQDDCIGPSGQSLVVHAERDLLPAEETEEQQLRLGLSRTDAGHHIAPFRLGEYVNHLDNLLQRNFAAIVIIIAVIFFREERFVFFNRPKDCGNTGLHLSIHFSIRQGRRVMRLYISFW